MAFRDLRGFRLILSDTLEGSGNQRMKKFEVKPLSIEQILSLLRDHFGLDEYVRSRGYDESVGARESFTFIGHDGPRRVPLRSDENLVSFLKGLQNTALPSVEAQLSLKNKQQQATEDWLQQRAKDRVEELEDDNNRLLRAWEKTERRMEELEQKRNKDLAQMRNEMNTMWQTLRQEQTGSIGEVQSKIWNLEEEDKAIRGQLDANEQEMKKSQKQAENQHGILSQQLEMLGYQIKNNRDDMERDIKALKEKDQRLQAEDASMRAELIDHARQITIIENGKLDVVVFEENNRKIEERINSEMAGTGRRIDDAEMQLTTRLALIHSELKAADAKLSTDIGRQSDLLSQLSNHIQEDLRNLEEWQTTRSDEISARLEQVNTDLIETIKTTDTAARTDLHKEIEELQADTKNRLEHTNKDLLAKDGAAHRRMDDMNLKFDEANKTNSGRIAGLDRLLGDTSARIRAELRAEAERLRASLDQEVARLDEELDAAHKKYDMTYLELNFCQNRVTEQREWAQKLFFEHETAREENQVEASKGLEALNKMLHALRDDEVEFRHTVANHIKALQGDTSKHEEEICDLEQHRKRIRLDLDGLAEDYHEYVGDMDGWSGDVRKKVERLFRSLEPTKVEWRIEKASQKIKKHPKPMTIRSDPFSISGIRDMRFDFYPNGHYNSPEGHAVLRIYAPAGTNIKYQSSLGRITDGAKEWQADAGDTLWTDVLFTRWEEEINESGDYIIIHFEIVVNHADADEVLGQTLRIETL